MAEITCTNTKVSPAWKGTAIIVTLSGADAITQLPQLSIGDACTIDSSTALGKVYSIDLYGHSFKVIPNHPEQWLGTGTHPDTAKNTFDINDSVTVVV